MLVMNYNINDITCQGFSKFTPPSFYPKKSLDFAFDCLYTKGNSTKDITQHTQRRGNKMTVEQEFTSEEIIGAIHYGGLKMSDCTSHQIRGQKFTNEEYEILYAPIRAAKWQTAWDDLKDYQQSLIIIKYPDIDKIKKHPVDKVWNNVSGWIIKLGLGSTCPRCGGTGKYSWNYTYGDVCFKCNGRKQVLLAKNIKTKKFRLAFEKALKNA